MNLESKIMANGHKADLTRGINGSGKSIWIIQYSRPLPDGKWTCFDDIRFDNEGEAYHWFKWACQ